MSKLDDHEYRYQNKPVCPYCGHVEHDDMEITLGPGLEGDGETTCNSCGEEYRISRHISISYTTKKR
jgi:hypothetical protein